MDRINLRLLKELSVDARMSYSELSKRVHLSAPAVTERIKRMEEEGIITGYKPQINLAKLGIPIRALIECEVHRTKEKEFRAILLTYDEIIKIYNITGATTFIVEVGTKTLEDLDDVLEKMIDYCDTCTKLVMRMPYDNVLPQHIENFISLE
ncbi:Lrp/AsnC family transcriptional regulator [Alteromonas sp. W364]|uniref:Lrp/AsnC family transcriptional regulator n=1 Tax=Alteromonas sp. W364 TaxID=3075610 RepID=UPI002885B486|nr:Lrp/AsnC family transcriptional regulator [Alteromonas sp. W364]MDT0628048.1 Lrp/AsnC family transcriptional regulator [Alteromonas sp. W364]